MQPFTYTGLPTRVIFGHGTLEKLGPEVDRLGISRALVLSTPHQRDMAEDTAQRLGSLAAGIFSEAAMHTPVDVTERAMREVERGGADGIVAIGGGSTTGLGKAIALRTDLPQLVVPTTYAGSEMTPILGQTENGRKTTLRDPKVLPETVIYDVSLTLGLPVKLSAVSGLNAIAHAVEALYAQDRNPVIDLMAEEGIAALARSLPATITKPDDLDARSDALYGAWLCGICLGSVGMALHHKLCHTLGGMFNLPHAETHAVILPHAMRYNMQAAPIAAGRVARALGAGDAAKGLQNLARRVGAPLSLKEIGMTAEGIDPAVAQAMANPYWNPEPLIEARIRDLLERAFHGSDV
ncbi:Alcohol dehydrogenase (plasmid) [Sinorhizobium sojae CCBAU 05684]|uniref:Alcohol dehydrogenase n=1 Tax=Sinorhizobium sojae CCBAU 05684 TaxID=716928 RepID=A0A249PIW5_9HYPH|nr:maleylacetate reductase [Sinorhizobium sojae]ASY65269.1 Alcohol dehydrogenase [Sinorhizobium sojae CCBAU 05684]